MDFLFVNTQELTVLSELPLSQRVAYLMGIRPYMDRQTCIVGIKRKISYQSIREILYVAPIPGVKTGYLSIQQLRRVVKSLERVGLISIKSTEKNLILKCLLAEEDKFVQNKTDIRPVPEVDARQVGDKYLNSCTYENIHRQAGIDAIAQGDIPHNSENKYVFLSKIFEEFWTLYPQPQNKTHAWNEFKKLDPDEVLFSEIRNALVDQVQIYQQRKAEGLWVPHWKYPANWLEQQCWNNELQFESLEEKNHATRSSSYAKPKSTDFFWESCKAGIEGN